MDHEEFSRSIAEAAKKWTHLSPLAELAERYKNIELVQAPSFTSALIEAAKVASTMQETLKVSFENLGLPSLAKARANLLVEK